MFLFYLNLGENYYDSSITGAEFGIEWPDVIKKFSERIFKFGKVGP